MNENDIERVRQSRESNAERAALSRWESEGGRTVHENSSVDRCGARAEKGGAQSTKLRR
jgi:hypothetical protein